MLLCSKVGTPGNPTQGKVGYLDPFLMGRGYLTFWKKWSSLIHFRESSLIHSQKSSFSHFPYLICGIYIMELTTRHPIINFILFHIINIITVAPDLRLRPYRKKAVPGLQRPIWKCTPMANNF